MCTLRLEHTCGGLIVLLPKLSRTDVLESFQATYNVLI